MTIKSRTQSHDNYVVTTKVIKIKSRQLCRVFMKHIKNPKRVDLFETTNYAILDTKKK